MKKAVQIIVNNTGGIGAIDDERKYKAFFSNIKGGAWTTDEILPTMYKPSADYLEKQLLQLEIIGVEYLVIVFSGHGGLSNNGRNTLLCLDGEGEDPDYNILDSALISNEQRRLVILDCCRTMERQGAGLLTESEDFIKAAHRVVPSAASVRRAYESAVSATPVGTAILYACEPTVGTTGADGEGGVFSNRLKDISCITGQVDPSLPGIYTIGDAHAAIKDLPDLYNPKTYCTNPSMMRLPWIVDPYVSRD